MTAPEPPVYWSPTKGVLQVSATGFGYSQLAGHTSVRELPSDAVRLVPAAGRDREPAPVYPQEWCDDMTGPNGAGGPCVLGPGHHHRDGIGGEWAWGASVVPAAAPTPADEAAGRDWRITNPAHAPFCDGSCDAGASVCPDQARRTEETRAAVAAPETTEETA